MEGVAKITDARLVLFSMSLVLCLVPFKNENENCDFFIYLSKEHFPTYSVCGHTPSYSFFLFFFFFFFEKCEIKYFN